MTHPRLELALLLLPTPPPPVGLPRVLEITKLALRILAGLLVGDEVLNDRPGPSRGMRRRGQGRGGEEGGRREDSTDLRYRKPKGRSG
jgi:hypothetical protein